MAMILKEKDGVLSEHDLQINIMCNFSAADSLVTSDQYSLEQETFHLSQKTFIPDSIQDDVHLQVSNAYSGESVTAAAIGSIVLLEMKYALQNGDSFIHSFIHSFTVVLCTVLKSPVKSFSREDDQKIVTPWFNLFAFEDEPSVAFQSDSQTGEYQQAHPPAAPPAYDMGPFVYVNPVTCSLFLLILLVFLCMYIAFIRTLRKSVYDIRKEIEVRRSRDKFLHCGCVQQKDKEYVAT
ncbi:unnamed protein product [Candidula unifasciata]|uniref:Uncharacterized protein n=1 Tax=Candidula unifasciata TaxID=100452 RepID=A0A8S4A3S0_9EUPU|nr:unnamed protein product [Candidula unifasciata]